MKVLISGFLFFFVIASSGQTVEEPPVSGLQSSQKGFLITGHAYPTGATGDIHKSFMIQNGITKSLKLELQGFYDTYILSERFRSSVLTKVYLNEKLYLLSGLEAEVATEKAGVGQTSYRLGVVPGAGYDINENFMIELKSNVQLNKSNIGVYGETRLAMPSVYTIGSKWKF
ncbi:hypothetical protein PXD56_17020 [Maribacter sp. SA7]|uniref:hypothetical protein n=1 Tax=Maribacter zhoushanensis TaxID=3030012 RepID=UPI0023EE06AD|nr:hypothetical protein [Maribacter zhoushanensis]MDF4204675.1 hypothetical protein [Maribacter zhoushanensis]